jgi:AcrR family transcriptional regulator
VPRPYRLSARAMRQAATRRRIVEAAVELHSTVGPARTSLSAVAERAGVSRPTVYAHFPDKPSLFAACSQEAMTADPWPDPRPWRSIADPIERLQHALGELYAHYGRTGRLTANILRDLDLLPQVPGRSLNDLYRAMRTALVGDWQVADDRRELLRAAVDHALDFYSWRSLVSEHEIDDAQAIELMTALVLAAAPGATSDSAMRRSRRLRTRR